MRILRLLAVLLSLSLAPVVALADSDGEQVPNMVAPGQQLEAYVFEDPHGVKKTIKEDTEVVLMSFEMDLSKKIHAYLEEKDPDYLPKHKAEYVIDISPMPSIITWLFAGPKMRKYPFPILLVDDDDFAERYPKEEGKIAAIELNKDRTISKIEFFENMEEVDKKVFQKPQLAITNLAAQSQSIAK